jgi:cobalt-zinc-cadmium efflux system membrane fusion protein
MRAGMSLRRAGALTAAIALFSPACTQSRAAVQAGPPPGETWVSADELTKGGVAVTPVEAHDVDDVLMTSGRIAFDEARVAHVLSPVTGRVEQIQAPLGAHVRKGDPLALLESPDLGVATSDLNKAGADLTAAEHDYARQKQLFEGKAASQAALEQSQDAWRKTKAEFERARRKVELLHSPGHGVTQYYPLTSPIDGDVIARNVNPGIEVQGMYSGGTSPELFTVGSLDDVWLFADIYEIDLARVKAGARVEVSVMGLSRAPIAGTIDWVSDALDPQTRTARLRCTLQNPDGLLKPEMYATVRVSVAPVQALAVPRSSLMHLGGQALVFVDRGRAEDGRERFERMPVVTDESGSGEWVPVQHGLDQGDRIAVKGVDFLSSRL